MKTIDKNTDYFGIDIGASSVRMVQLKPGGEKPEVGVYGEREISPEIQQADDEKYPALLADVILGLKQELGISSNDAVVAIPNRYAFTTVIETKKLDPGSLATYIWQNASRYLPVPLEEVRLDWQVINPDKSADSMDVLLVAAQNEAVDYYVRLIAASRLRLLALEVNAIAMSRSVTAATDPPVVVVDLGKVNTELTVVWRRVPNIIKASAVGYERLVSEIESSFRVERAQAEEFLREFGFLPTKLEGGVAKSVEAAVGEIISDITSLIQTFAANNPEFGIKKVVLTGAPTALPGLPSYIAERLSLPVEIANPWMNTVYPAARHDQLMSKSLHYAVAAGLAQREFL